MRIAIEDLSKTYGKTVALSHVNLVIEDGVFGLIGPNASGKTTLLRILATRLKPSGGRVTLGSWDLNRNRGEIRAITGYLPQRFSTFPKLTTREFLDYSASLAGLRDKKARNEEVEYLLESLGLSGVRNVFADELPVVMKRHLEIAQSVVGSPRMLLVDEPTLGLSPEERIRFRAMLMERSKKVENIVMTSHIFSDISSTCSSVAVLDRGTVAYSGPPENLPEQGF